VIVELIGCAGAGKTTLRRIIRERGIPGVEVVAMPELVLDRALLRGITHPTAVNLVQEAAVLPGFLRPSPSERAFIAFARRRLRRCESTYDRLNGLRGIMRKVGMLRLATVRAPQKVVLSDEGTLLSAYNLFVMAGDALVPSEIDRFAGLVPLPDRVVYVKAPVETLVDRALSRPDTRRQHRRGTAAHVGQDVARTVELFDLVAGTPAVADRVLVVENEVAGDAAVRLLAEEISTWIEASIAGAPHAEPVVTKVAAGSGA
jgi:hypothetical protein